MSAPPCIAQNHMSSAVHLSPPHWPCRSFYTAPHSCPSLVSCLSSLHAIGTQRDTGLAETSVVQYACALRRHHCRIPEP
uniref:Uncharacterized protein n=1 Tax=Mesocestoides corti TaxID=53468 RepID=A0A5K3FS79_MESCO